ncbi:hypothetical protein Efla_006078 [Eimeria flavescens]
MAQNLQGSDRLCSACTGLATAQPARRGVCVECVGSREEGSASALGSGSVTPHPLAFGLAAACPPRAAPGSCPGPRAAKEEVEIVPGCGYVEGLTGLERKVGLWDGFELLIGGRVKLCRGAVLAVGVT